MGTTPWKGEEYVVKSDDHPATYISWNDCQHFVERLNEIDAERYRLPKSGEWELACLADLKRDKYSTSIRLITETTGKIEGLPCAPGKVKGTVNKWGLNRIYEGIWEWCLDADEFDPLCNIILGGTYLDVSKST